jgi:hypothetical protein
MLEQVYGGPLSQNPDGGNDTLTFYDNSDTVTATGTADNLTFDGLHEDVIMSNGTVSYTTSGIANPGGNNNIGVTGSNDTIALAGSVSFVPARNERYGSDDVDDRRGERLAWLRIDHDQRRRRARGREPDELDDHAGVERHRHDRRRFGDADDRLGQRDHRVE